MTTNRDYMIKLAHMYEAHSHDEVVYMEHHPLPHSLVTEENKAKYGHLAFFTVGRNATHYFSLAVDESDKVYYRSLYKDYEPIWGDRDPEKCDWQDPNTCPVDYEDIVEEHIHLLEDDIQVDAIYMGHW